MINDLTTEKVILFLIALYPNFKVTPETIAAYRLMLADIPPEKLQTAAMHACSRSKFFPTVAELRDAAFDLVEAGNGAITASEAWGRVYRAVGKFGYPSPGKAKEALTEMEWESVMAIGGWHYLCCISDNITADRARFLEAYEAKAKRQKGADRMLPAVRATLQGADMQVRIKQLLASKRL